MSAYANKIATMLLNELMPRARRAGVEPDQLCSPEAFAVLVHAEMSGAYTRRGVRNILDFFELMATDQRRL
jgi:hypothetical protein